MAPTRTVLYQPHNARHATNSVFLNKSAPRTLNERFELLARQRKQVVRRSKVIDRLSSGEKFNSNKDNKDNNNSNNLKMSIKSRPSKILNRVIKKYKTAKIAPVPGTNKKTKSVKVPFVSTTSKIALTQLHQGKNASGRQHKKPINGKAKAPSPMTADDLDKSLDEYMMKYSNIVQSRLNDDLESYMNQLNDDDDDGVKDILLELL